jgi:CBS domain-containing protein
MKALEMMTKDVITVSLDTTVREIAALLVRHRISGMPVATADRMVVGMVSQSDLLRRAETGSEQKRKWWLTTFADPGGMAREFVKAISAGVLAIAAGYAPADAKGIFQTAAGDIVVETIASGLEQPWSLAFLPDGRMLVTERPGRMRIVTREGALSAPIEGVPVVFTVAGRQPGLLGVALDLNYTRNQTLYFCYVEPVDGGGRTVVASARLIDEEPPRLDQVRTIFRARGAG